MPRLVAALMRPSDTLGSFDGDEKFVAIALILKETTSKLFSQHSIELFADKMISYVSHLE